jgi:hypothetical protein
MDVADRKERKLSFDSAHQLSPANFAGLFDFCLSKEAPSIPI